MVLVERRCKSCTQFNQFTIKDDDYPNYNSPAPYGICRAIEFSESNVPPPGKAVVRDCSIYSADCFVHEDFGCRMYDSIYKDVDKGDWVWEIEK